MALSELLNNLQNSIDFYAIVFYILAALVVGAGLITILSRKLMHSAVALLFAFFGVAGLYALLAADFIAVTQIMVYIGGILTLIIFGVILTSKINNVKMTALSIDSTTTAIGAIISVICGVGLSVLYIFTDWNEKPIDTLPVTTLQDIGNLLFTNYLIGFIAVAILLLVAFIGAALIARRKN